MKEEPKDLRRSYCFKISLIEASAILLVSSTYRRMRGLKYSLRSNFQLLQCERILVSNDIVQAGEFCIKQCQTITSDKVILDIVKGHKLDFITMPTQAFPPQQPKFEKHEANGITLLKELIQKGVIVKCFHEDGEFISPIFL